MAFGRRGRGTIAVLVYSLVVSVAFVGGVKLAVVVAVVVPVLYALVTKMLDHCVTWELKGRRSRGEYRIWTDDGHDPDWKLYSGDVDELVTLHGNGSRVAHVEQSVRFWKGNPYSLGLDLTAGAIAVDVTSLIGGQGAYEYLGWAVLLHSLLLVGVIALVVSNQNSSPKEVRWMQATAALAIFLGLAAMGTSFLALDAELINGILNLDGDR